MPVLDIVITVLRFILRRKSWAAPRHGARVRYLLGTDVNTPFFQAPTTEFVHRAGAGVVLKH